MLTENMLSELGYEVSISVTTLEAGLQAATGECFELAVLDINLRGVMSFPIADILIERGTPFNFTSGYVAQGFDPRYSKIPALQKPFTVESLAQILSRALCEGHMRAD